MSNRRTILIAGMLLGVLGCAQVVSLLGESQTWDEGIHLASGYIYLRTGENRLSPEHPPLGRALCALPLLAFDLLLDESMKAPPAPQAGFRFVFRNRLSPDLILNAGRMVTVGLTLLFGAWVAWWTAHRFSTGAALAALGLFCLDPNLTAHGRYVTTDLIASFLIFLAVTLWFDYLSAPAIWRAAAAGAAMGAALGSKNSALFLIPVLVAAGLWRRRWLGTAGLLTAACITLGAIYAPEYLRTGEFSYLKGIESLRHQNTVGEPGYLLGQVSNHGWWYYFPIAFATKTPLGALLSLSIAAATAWRMRERRLMAALAAVAAAFFGVCMASSITIGHRHILPLYAFLYVIAGAALSQYRKLAIACLALAAFEWAWIHPHYLAFFNAAAGGPARGPSYLVDSNIDWGQEAKRLGRFLAANQVDRACLAYFGNAEVQRYGVEFSPMPRSAAEADCVAAVSVTALAGVYGDPASTAWLRELTPAARIGHAIYVYDLRRTRTPLHTLD